MKLINQEEFNALNTRTRTGVYSEFKKKVLGVIETGELNGETVGEICQFNLKEDFQIERIHYQSGFLKLKRDDDVKKTGIEISALKRTEEQDPHYVYEIAVKF